MLVRTREPSLSTTMLQFALAEDVVTYYGAQETHTVCVEYKSVVPNRRIVST